MPFWRIRERGTERRGDGESRGRECRGTEKDANAGEHSQTAALGQALLVTALDAQHVNAPVRTHASPRACSISALPVFADDPAFDAVLDYVSQSPGDCGVSQATGPGVLGGAMRKFNLANGIWLGGDAERVRATRRDAARHGASTVRAARGAAPCEQSRPPAERRAAAAAAAAGALPPLSVRRSPSPANSRSRRFSSTAGGATITKVTQLHPV